MAFLNKNWLTLTFYFCMFGLTQCSSNENARNFNVDALVNYVCQDYSEVSPQTNVCGQKSVWLEADSGVIAFITVYGISSLDEAKSIFNFVKKMKKDNNQNISVEISIFSSPRSAGRELEEFLILKDKI